MFDFNNSRLEEDNVYFWNCGKINETDIDIEAQEKVKLLLKVTFGMRDIQKKHLKKQ